MENYIRLLFKNFGIENLNCTNNIVLSREEKFLILQQNLVKLKRIAERPLFLTTDDKLQLLPIQSVGELVVNVKRILWEVRFDTTVIRKNWTIV